MEVKLTYQEFKEYLGKDLFEMWEQENWDVDYIKDWEIKVNTLTWANNTLTVSDWLVIKEWSSNFLETLYDLITKRGTYRRSCRPMLVSKNPLTLTICDYEHHQKNSTQSR